MAAAATGSAHQSEASSPPLIRVDVSSFETGSLAKHANCDANAGCSLLLHQRLVSVLAAWLAC